MDLSDRRELNNGAGDALARAVELALTPAIFALIGWWLDRRLNTFPIVMLVLFAIVMTYEIWKMFTQYDATMKRKEAELFDRRDGQDRKNTEDTGS